MRDLKNIDEIPPDRGLCDYATYNFINCDNRPVGNAAKSNMISSVVSCYMAAASDDGRRFVSYYDPNVSKIIFVFFIRLRNNGVTEWSILYSGDNEYTTLLKADFDFGTVVECLKDATNINPGLTSHDRDLLDEYISDKYGR